MNEFEVKMMHSMIDLLNHAKDSYYVANKPVLTEEQYNTRFKDLKEFEEETGLVFSDSPTIEKMSGISVSVENTPIYYDCEECNKVEDIIKFANQKELLVYPNLIGMDIAITYKDGVMTEIYVNDDEFKYKKVNGVPYKINKKDRYVVFGKVLHNNSTFYVYDVLVYEQEQNNGIENLNEAKELGFYVVPNWINTDFSVKKIQTNINYVNTYMEKEEKFMLYDGIIFRCNDTYECDAIIYKDNEIGN